MAQPDPVEQARAAVERFSAAYESAAAAIRAVADPDVAFGIANDLSERVNKLKSHVAALRTDTAGRIWDSERMSLAALAGRIGVSTTRAHQLITEVKQRRERSDDG